ncbi:hypothetical protein A3D11_01375 [Candidatus Peribacteria bacterium RIFCSPHIGHO2_02_FULL_49_16]|nr:MAG: hypothetical protein A2880_00570 [Candidatus Peribacteria bacterium RIFCSPHIGHO2_01_FULL_49_38]OGJ59678.1 MAG: hypothetical protein A3D11_01375 [Candidatus Peribacteria bacterium RIFCSPHIGHO2_02_FULL_49_16]
MSFLLCANDCLFGSDLPDLHGQNAIAELREHTCVLRDENGGFSIALHAVQVVHALDLKLIVSHGDDLIKQVCIGIHMCCRGKREAHPHSHAVTLDRNVAVRIDVGERHDRRHFSADLRSRHPVKNAVQKDILFGTPLGVETHPQFEKARENRLALHRAFIWFKQSGEDP